MLPLIIVLRGANRLLLTPIVTAIYFIPELFGFSLFLMEICIATSVDQRQSFVWQVKGETGSLLNKINTYDLKKLLHFNSIFFLATRPSFRSAYVQWAKYSMIWGKGHWNKNIFEPFNPKWIPKIEVHCYLQCWTKYPPYHFDFFTARHLFLSWLRSLLPPLVRQLWEATAVYFLHSLGQKEKSSGAKSREFDG